MGWMTDLASSASDNSLAARFRRRRFAVFLELLENISQRPVSILDVGGLEIFWEIMGLTGTQHSITLLNLEASPTRHSNVRSVIGDARNLSCFPDKSFDVVFSNSVIEHLSSLNDQTKMATETMRVGKHYFVQTPNFYFLLEPHFLTPFFHWLPRKAQLWMHSRFDLGHFKKAGSASEAQRIVDEIRLLTLAEFKNMFPGSTIYRERVIGLTKSFIAYA